MLAQRNHNKISSLELSVVVPVHNEVGNVEPLAHEIQIALEKIAKYEIIFVNDCSCDGTSEKLDALKREITCLRVLTHKKKFGQSAAIRSGVKATAAPLVVTLDGDGQNNPNDIPSLLQAYKEHSALTPNVMVCGHRYNRQDSSVKLMSSKIANIIRSSLLGDSTLDTGCGLKVFRVEDFMELPGFDHMHRFLPALMIRNGGQVISVKVSHRPRERGSSNYGTFDRLWVGISDLFGMIWLKRRLINIEAEESE
jgi:dolichol-phosphate mannosyltransferase